MPETDPNLIRPQVIVFDLYETLLDMSDIERRVNLLTDSKRGYIIWFELLMQYCFVTNSLDRFQGFISIAKATLKMTGKQLGKAVSDNETNDVLELLKHLPVHEDVQPGLSQLGDKGYRIIALTNVPEKIVCERMERTGLVSYFEEVLGAEAIKKYKPEKEVYQWAAKKLNVSPGQMLMVTSHSWDIAGAANAGMKTARLKRDRHPFYPLSPGPDFTANTLPELVSLLEK